MLPAMTVELAIILKNQHQLKEINNKEGQDY
jgi:hypothetical protein